MIVVFQAFVVGMTLLSLAGGRGGGEEPDSDDDGPGWRRPEPRRPPPEPHVSWPDFERQFHEHVKTDRARDEVSAGLTAGMETTVVMLGPPGSGKGTQAARLRDGLGYEVLSTGELLRSARAAGTELGRRAGEYMDRGELVPDELVVTVLEDAIHRLGERRIIFDGFPRTVAQARALDRALAARGRRVNAAILIDIPDDEVVRPDPLAPPGALGQHAWRSPRTAARLSRPDRAARHPLRGPSAAATR